MTLLSVQGLSVSAGGLSLFSDVNFEITEGERIGLVGPNGSGKTTLLRTLIKEIEPDKGEVTGARSLRIAMLRQLLTRGSLDQTVRELVHNAMPPDHRDSQAYLVEVTLDELGVPVEMWERPLGALSGGWQRLAQLAAVSIAEPTLMILDEPTNFLDIENIVRLEAWLNDPRRPTFLVISHDRGLLDSCTNRTLAIHDSKIVSIAHPFSAAMAVLREREVAEQKALEVQDREIQRLTYTYNRLQHWGHTFNVKKLSSRAKSVAKRVDRLKKSRSEGHTADKRRLELKSGAVSSDFILRIEDAEITTPDNRSLFKIDRLVIAPGERLIILGRNGVGKSTLMRMIDGVLKHPERTLSSGRISISPQVRHSYFEQDLECLPGDVTPLAWLLGRFGGNRTRLIGSLVGIGINYNKVDHRIDTLSGGQQSRLLLLAMELEEPNLYLLDEPTNHLDIAGMEQLEFELCTGTATAITVSHDRRFITEVGTRFLVISDGRLTEIEDPEVYYEGLAAPAQPVAPKKPRKHPRAEPVALWSEEDVLSEIMDLESRYSDAATRPREVERALAALYRRLDAAQS